MTTRCCWPPTVRCGYFAAYRDPARPCSQGIHSVGSFGLGPQIVVQTAMARRICCATFITGFQRGSRILEHRTPHTGRAVRQAARSEAPIISVPPISIDPLVTAVRWQQPWHRLGNHRFSGAEEPIKPTRSPSGHGHIAFRDDGLPPNRDFSARGNRTLIVRLLFHVMRVGDRIDGIAQHITKIFSATTTTVTRIRPGHTTVIGNTLMEFDEVGQRMPQLGTTGRHTDTR